MKKSTLEYKSNLQEAKSNVPLLDDREFLRNIIDPFAIRNLKKFKEKELTEIQRQIYDKVAIPCRYADNGDYPWGMIRDENGKPRVVCKCLKTTCKYFKECRPRYKDTEITYVSNSYEEKILKSNTELTVAKNISCTFQQYSQYTRQEKMRVLLEYWEMQDGPLVNIKLNETGESNLFNDKGMILQNPFTQSSIIITNIDMYKFSYFVFDISDMDNKNDDLIKFIYSGRRDDCKNYAQEILYDIKPKESTKTEIDKKATRIKTTSQIKERHRLKPDPKLCRHAGCNELAVRDGYCSEHIRYQKAESK